MIKGWDFKQHHKKIMASNIWIYEVYGRHEEQYSKSDGLLKECIVMQSCEEEDKISGKGRF